MSLRDVDGPRATTEDELLAALYHEHASVLLAFVSRFVDQRQDAEDVVQETLLRAWRNLDAIDPAKGDPRSYLFTVARNLATDRWRAAQRRPRLLGTAAAARAERRAQVADGVDRILDRWLVQQGLERLSDEHRAVVDALYFRGCTIAEAALSLGVAQGTVKSRSYYAVRALRTIFEEIGMSR